MALATIHDRYSSTQIDAFYSTGEWASYSLFGALEEQVGVRPDKRFFFDSTTGYTYRQARDAALALAAGLRDHGVERGDRVAVQIPNWAEFVVIAVALSRIGAIIVPIMPIYRRDEVGYIVETAGVKLAFTCGTHHGFDHADLFLELASEENALESVVELRQAEARAGVIPFESLLAETPGELGADSSPDDPFAIVFTSGTTSRPKGCLHTFNTMACGARLLGRGFEYTDADVQFGPSPITHTTGLVTSVILPLVHGASSYVMESWNPVDALGRIEQFGCTISVTATTFLQTLVEVYDPQIHDAGGLRLWTAAGSPIPGSFITRSRQRLPSLQVLSLYGRTENVTTTMCTTQDDPSRSVTSDGRALPRQEVRIVDGDGVEVDRGTEGDIAYRGAMNLLEYVGQPEQTALIFTPDGFSLSGDLGVMDDDGYVRVTGRLKDIVIRGGLNISVRQVEDLLTEHPAIRAVAVVAMPDERLGERACVYLAVTPGVEVPTLLELKEFLLARGLAVQKVPERIEIVESLPMTATGKVQKHLLRADVASKLAALA